MASSSSGARALAALLLACTALPGCWTGHLLESARRWESTLRYERAFRAGDRLYLEYDVAVRDRRGEELRRGRRRAVLALSDLAERPEHPIDELPVEFDARPAPGDAEPVPLLRERGGAPAAALVLRVVDGAERETGLTLEAPGDPATAGRLHSGSLTRDRMAPWAWPLVPVALVLDAGVLPLHVLGIGFFYLTPE